MIRRTSSTRRRRLLAAGVVGLASPLALAVTAEPASAHLVQVFQGIDVVTVASDHLEAQVCNEERDGRAVRAIFTLADGTVFQEADGADLGCDFVKPGTPIVAVQLCEIDPNQSDPCSDNLSV
jgi:hypothetical protein